MLGSLADNLVEALPDDAYPGEGNAAVVVEMLRGSMAPASLDDADVARDADMMSLAGEEPIEQLEGACELAQRTHSGPDSIGDTTSSPACAAIEAPLRPTLDTPVAWDSWA